MAGDRLLVDPTYSGTMAVIVNAPPEHIWPWLVQMGYQRGGLYSYDWLDRLFGYLDRPSATRILPSFRTWRLVTKSLWARPCWPVAAIESRRALVLDMRNMGGFDWVWQFGLYPVDEKEHASCPAAACAHRLSGPGCSRCDRACGICHDAADAAGSETAGTSRLKSALAV